MTYVGMDVHQKTSTLVMLDPATGVTDKRRIETTRGQLQEALSRWERPWVVAIEATRQTPAATAWLREMGAQIHLAEPQKLDALAKLRIAKTDAKDAQLLLYALTHDLLPECYLAPPQIMELRALSRGRDLLSKINTMLRNMGRTLLSQAGLQCLFTDLRGKGAQAGMPGLLAQLAPNARRMAEAYDTLLGVVQQLLAQVDAQIQREVAADPIARALTALTGVGPVIALALRAEIADIERFAAPKYLYGYAGVVPKVQQSDTFHQTGSVPRRCNKRLRYWAIQAAQCAANSRKDSPAKSSYERVRNRCGPNPAKVAGARVILKEVFGIWRRLQSASPSPGA